MNMRRSLQLMVLLVLLILSSPVSYVSGADGPQSASMVIVLPNPGVTPGWRDFAPPECKANPEDCVKDSHGFWEWDFKNFADAIDAAFRKIAAAGYRRVVPIIPLSDTLTFTDNIKLMFAYAAKYGLAFDPAIFPKYKWGAEWCYLYSSGAPADCAVVDVTSRRAVAYVKMTELMNYVQPLKVLAMLGLIADALRSGTGGQTSNFLLASMFLTPSGIACPPFLVTTRPLTPSGWTNLSLSKAKFRKFCSSRITSSMTITQSSGSQQSSTNFIT